MKKILLAVMVLVQAARAGAQFTYNYLKAANGYYSSGDYYSAAVYYEKYLHPGKGNQLQIYTPYTAQEVAKSLPAQVAGNEQVIYNLAESYRLLHYPSNAEPYYKQSTQLNNRFPLALYHLAVTERELGRYDTAAVAFLAFIDQHAANDTYRQSAEKELQNLQFIRQQLNKDTSLYSIRQLPVNLGTASYAPVFKNKDTVLFTATNKAGDAPVLNHIYQAVYTGNQLNQVSAVAMPEAKAVHQGVLSITPDGKRCYVTRWTTANGKKTAAIYTSEKTAAGWSEPVALNSVVNVPGHSAQQPFVMPGGEDLLFASDRPDGFGGYDIWSAHLNAAGEPETAVNLGAAINTAFDEQAPYYHPASASLVFASNGRVGMGGYDLYYAKGDLTHWAAPQDFGYPVNSVKDDIYFASKGGAKNILENVLLSSDRASACCLDLFWLQKKMPPRKLGGVVVACDTHAPVAGAAVSLIDTVHGGNAYTFTTTADGRYAVVMADWQALKITAAADGYQPGVLQFAGVENDTVEAVENPAICLAKTDVPKTISHTPTVISNVYFQLNEAKLLNESFAALDSLAAMLQQQPSVVIEISGHTDSTGSKELNQRLSEARAQSVVHYLESKGIAAGRLKPVGYGDTRPLAPNSNPDGSDSPEGRKLNRRTEYRVLLK